MRGSWWRCRFNGSLFRATRGKLVGEQYGIVFGIRTYLLTTAGTGAVGSGGTLDTLDDEETFEELPLRRTLLALLMNLLKPCPFPFSSPPPDPPWAEELIVRGMS